MTDINRLLFNVSAAHKSGTDDDFKEACQAVKLANKGAYAKDLLREHQIKFMAQPSAKQFEVTMGAMLFYQHVVC